MEDMKVPVLDSWYAAVCHSKETNSVSLKAEDRKTEEKEKTLGNTTSQRRQWGNFLLLAAQVTVLLTILSDQSVFSQCFHSTLLLSVQLTWNFQWCDTKKRTRYQVLPTTAPSKLSRVLPCSGNETYDKTEKQKKRPSPNCFHKCESTLQSKISLYAAALKISLHGSTPNHEKLPSAKSA